MKYNIVFSIPIHEKFEVVLDQVINFFYYNNNCAIVFHISQGFNYESSLISKDSFIQIISKIGNVFVNPESVRTGLGDIIQVHLSNFKYISTKAEFDFFCMSASNDMFIKKGMYDYIKNYDCGYCLVNVLNIDWHWRTGESAKKDDTLKRIMKELNTEVIYGSQIEGTYYKKELFANIVREIENYFDYKLISEKYPRDEIYFTTVAEALQGQKDTSSLLKGNLVTYIPWRTITMNIKIRKIVELQTNDDAFYCVKRVPRNLNDSVRQYLRKTGGYYKDEINMISSAKIGNIYILYLNELYRELSIHISIMGKRIKNMFIKLCILPIFTYHS